MELETFLSLDLFPLKFKNIFLALFWGVIGPQPPMDLPLYSDFKTELGFTSHQSLQTFNKQNV